MPGIYKYINRFRDTVDNAWADTADNVWRKLIRIVARYTRGTRKRATPLEKNSPSFDYGRKPYIYGLKRHSPKSDYSDMMREVPLRAMMDQKLQKQSEFEKPYLHDDYQEMQYLWPSLPGFTFPPFDMPRSRIPTESQYQGGGCVIVLQNPHECNEPVKVAIPAFQFVGGQPSIYDELIFDIKVNGSTHMDYDIEERVFPLWIYPPYKDDSLGDDYAYRWQEATQPDLDVVEITMTDGAKNICYDSLTVRPGSCPEAVTCDCDTADAFQLDTSSTPSTIVSGDTITVYVLGGCPPFTWSPTAGDYWFESATTYARSNVLHAGGGGCGNIASYSSLDIIDNCGSTSVMGIVIKMTDGGWSSWGTFCSGASCGPGRYCEGTAADYSAYKYCSTFQDGDVPEGCNILCCSEGITYVASGTCWVNCVSDTAGTYTCRREGTAGGGYSMKIKAINVAISEWSCT